MSEPVLCYVKDQKAIFTTQELSKQLGDDWDDRPYEHNAGEPYFPWSPGEDWQLTTIYFESELVTPDYGCHNSPYSVDDINSGAVAWLRNPYKSGQNIHAGTTLSEFKRLIKEFGGKVYVLEP